MEIRPIFWGFCINRFGIGPLHYISSRSDFGFEFADIFVIEKWLPNSQCLRVHKKAYRYNFVKPWLRFCQIDLVNGWFSCLKFGKSMLNFKNLNSDSPIHHGDSPTRRVRESPTLWVGDRVGPNQNISDSSSLEVDDSQSRGVDDLESRLLNV